MERRSFVRSAGIAGVLAAGAAPAFVNAQANIRWRLASSFPKSLDTLYGTAIASNYQGQGLKLAKQFR